MKFLHTADLHLGKLLHEHSLLEDQRFLLNALLETLDDSYDALVIAGDVYDRSIPPPDAVKLFGPFLGDLKKKHPALEVFLIPGNHDSASRLAFGKELFAELGVHFVTEAEDADKPIIIKTAATTAFFLLPFLTAGSLKQVLTAEADAEPLPLRSQSKLAFEASARLKKALAAAKEAGADYTVLVAHLFATGGAGSDSERVFLGNAEQVDISLFDGFDYIALGHLHQYQKVGANAYYSGSPLAYSFSEAKHEKCFLSVSLDKGGVSVDKVPITPLRKLSRFKGTFDTFFTDKLSDALKTAADDYLEITLTNQTLVENPMSLLRRQFPYLLNIRQDEALNVRLRENDERLRIAVPSASRNIVDDFTDFLMDIHGEVHAEEVALFKEFLSSEGADE